LKVSTVGLSVPKIFHFHSYENIKQSIEKYKWKNYQIYSQFLFAWNGIIYRYKSIDYHDKRFTKSIKIFGDAPPFTQRLIQERELFNFFSNSYSIFENFAYSLYIFCFYINPNKFPINSEEDLKYITFASIKKNINTIYSQKSITNQLNNIISDKNYQLIKQYRNILSHRSTPGRHINRAIGGENKPSLWNEDIVLDENLTRNLKKWIYCSVNILLDEIYSFIDENK